MPSTKWDLSKSEGKLEELERLLSKASRQRVLVLCHNNPDPDSIAGAAGFCFLLRKKFGIRAVQGYGGMITRAENVAMVNRLRIKMTRMQSLKPHRYYAIALVDAQPGTGNNLIDAKSELPLIVIDHHPLRKHSQKAQFYDVRPTYGATSTIVTEYLRAAGLTPTRSLANALLYGIKTDTSSLARGASGVDFEAFKYLSPLTNPRVIGWIENPPLNQNYFQDLHRGLSNAIIYRDVVVADLGDVHSEAIVPELADRLLRIDGVKWVMCMARKDKQMLISLRSTSRKHRAGLVVRKLVGRLGAAGGHATMAGGLIPLNGRTEKEVQDLADSLILKALKLIKHQGCQAKPLVTECVTDRVLD